MLSALQGLIAWLPVGLPAFLFVFTPIVFFHELGHFSVARAFGVKIETFSIGFGREVFGWSDRHGTRWKFGWLPIGGYVKFFGDADAASTPDRESEAKMSAAERSQALQFKPLYQRALVVAAGPFANFILAIVIFATLFMLFGRTVQAPVIGAVVPGSAAQQAGILPGDVIEDINGTRITEFGQVPEIVMLSAGQDLSITLARAGHGLNVHATPRITRIKDSLGDFENVPALGIQNSTTVKLTVIHYGPLAAIGAACSQTWAIVTDSLAGLKQMALGRVDTGQMSGTLNIANMTRKVARFGIFALINLAALISVSLGLVNLFPIPVLDGGHLLYYGCEAVLGRPLGERVQEAGFRFGLALVLGLILFSAWNDLTHHLNLF
jgi:regulator of sigma E protease